MTVSAPPRPDDPVEGQERAALEALIEEARRRARRRRRIYGAVAVSFLALGGLAVVTLLERSAPSQTASPPEASGSSIDASATQHEIAFVRYPTGRGQERSGLWVVGPGGGQPRLVARSRGFGNGPLWSPDGRRVAFVRLGRDEPGLYVLTADGRGERRLWPEAVFLPAGSWSPDGTRIAFATYARARATYVGGRNDIYAVNVDGSGLRNLTRGRVPRSAFRSWSPDGRRVAFSNTSLFVMNADGSEMRRLAKSPKSPFRWIDWSSWSPDGRRIAFSNASGLFVMNADGSELRLLARAPRPFHTNRLTQPRWSPDGRTILYLSISYLSDSDSDTSRSEVHVVNADGSGQRQLTSGMRDTLAVWSPDGSKIAFLRSPGPPGLGPGLAPDPLIHVVNADGSGLRNLGVSTVINFPPIDNSPSWSPDGRELSFVARGDGGTDPVGLDIHVMKDDGTDRRALTRGPDTDIHPVWSPRRER